MVTFSYWSISIVIKIVHNFKNRLPRLCRQYPYLWKSALFAIKCNHLFVFLKIPRTNFFFFVTLLTASVFLRRRFMFTVRKDWFTNYFWIFQNIKSERRGRNFIRVNESTTYAQPNQCSKRRLVGIWYFNFWQGQKFLFATTASQWTVDLLTHLSSVHRYLRKSSRYTSTTARSW